jgi:hypothetical protein
LREWGVERLAERPVVSHPAPLLPERRTPRAPLAESSGGPASANTSASFAAIHALGKACSGARTEPRVGGAGVALVAQVEGPQLRPRSCQFEDVTRGNVHTWHHIGTI